MDSGGGQGCLSSVDVPPQHSPQQLLQTSTVLLKLGAPVPSPKCSDPTVLKTPGNHFCLHFKTFLPSPLPSSDPTLLPSQYTPAYFSSFQLKNFQRKHLEGQKSCASWRAGSFLMIKCTFQLQWLPPTVMGCVATESLFPKKWV